MQHIAANSVFKFRISLRCLYLFLAVFHLYVCDHSSFVSFYLRTPFFRKTLMKFIEVQVKRHFAGIQRMFGPLQFSDSDFAIHCYHNKDSFAFSQTRKHRK